jgi:hypothetical protein
MQRRLLGNAAHYLRTPLALAACQDRASRPCSVRFAANPQYAFAPSAAKLERGIVSETERKYLDASELARRRSA